MERDDEHRAWEQRLGRIAQAAASWQALTRQPPAVEVGSELGEDRLPALDVAGIVWFKIAIAAEHLSFFSDVIRATSTLYPTSYLTVLRTGLLAASHAAWVLNPAESAARRFRALRLEAEDLRAQVAMIRGPWPLSSDLERIRDADLLKLAERQDRLAATAASIGVREDVRRIKVDTTDAIANAAGFLRSDPVASSGVQLLWRTGSAVAHAQRSHALLRLDRSELVSHGEGVSSYQLRGDLVRDIGPAAAAVFLMLGEALRLWDLRRKGGSHSTST